MLKNVVAKVLETESSTALTVLRIGLGAVILAHGAQAVRSRSTDGSSGLQRASRIRKRSAERRHVRRDLRRSASHFAHR